MTIETHLVAMALVKTVMLKKMALALSQIALMARTLVNPQISLLVKNHATLVAW